MRPTYWEIAIEKTHTDAIVPKDHSIHMQSVICTSKPHVHYKALRPVITYGSIVWHALSGTITKDARKITIEIVAIIQNRCLWAEAHTYKQHIATCTSTPLDQRKWRVRKLVETLKEYIIELRTARRKTLSKNALLTNDSSSGRQIGPGSIAADYTRRSSHIQRTRRLGGYSLRR